MKLPVFFTVMVLGCILLVKYGLVFLAHNFHDGFWVFKDELGELLSIWPRLLSANMRTCQTVIPKFTLYLASAVAVTRSSFFFISVILSGGDFQTWCFENFVVGETMRRMGVAFQKMSAVLSSLRS